MITEVGARHNREAGREVNTPPPERRWLRITAESRIGPPSADSGHTKVVIWLGLSLRFDVFHPDFIGHVATACNPIAPCPQVLAPVAFAQAGKLGQQLVRTSPLSGIAQHATPTDWAEWTATYGRGRD